MQNYGISQIQKRANEDIYQIGIIGKIQYYAVFDGHGGPFKLDNEHVAKYCADNLHIKLQEYLDEIDINDEQCVCEQITKAFISLDIEMYNNKIEYGSTCTCLLIDKEREKIYQVNLGDSRSVIFVDDEIISVTDDHQPDDHDEIIRILKAGGNISYGRVNGDLAVTRSFGDFDLKSNKEVIYDPVNGIISAIPDIKIIQIQDKMMFMITSDAPFEDMNLARFFKETIKQLSLTNYNFSLTTLQLTHWLKHQTSDDITIIIGKV